ncbi:hypothetical protein [Pelomicrobium methylotrophicum]|uniref:Response regulatory domain-containing protein n=1 Tax=Pelomicrobium methylotrophicum TaxID=2602750 RepID=A0A5C7EJ29_9PROT|nr:hypothetical protein [Pelomicrobium methylotrophicum]TXF12097.1 hypothetical protein FR698_07575 [Pelomicrobium methylotrophicum]
MTIPTVKARLERKLIVMTTDPLLLDELRAALPSGWTLVECTDLEALGGYQDVLLHRFILLDLDETQAFDPLEVIKQVRMEMMLNVPIFCFGGDAPLRDEARLARADRFFERHEIVEKMRLYCEQFGWGAER